MKIIFWNIGYVPGLDGSFYHYVFRGHRLMWSPVIIQMKLLDGIAGHINQEAPDLVLYSEVSTGARRNSRFHQHNYLVEKVGSVVGHGVEGKYSRAVLERFPLHKGNSNGFLSPHECMVETLHLASGRKTLVYVVIVKGITVVMVHLSLNKSIRKRQFIEIAEIVKNIPGPVVLCGDMNIFAGRGELKTLMDQTGLALPPELPKTFPSHKPKHTLDIFLTRGMEGQISMRTIQTTISDHLPIVLEW